LATAALQVADRGDLDLDDQIDRSCLDATAIASTSCGRTELRRSGLSSRRSCTRRKALGRGANLDRVEADHLGDESEYGWNYSNAGCYFVRQKIELDQSAGHRFCCGRDLSIQRLVPPYEGCRLPLMQPPRSRKKKARRSRFGKSPDGAIDQIELLADRECEN
jgi:hypothetical protein